MILNKLNLPIEMNKSLGLRYYLEVNKRTNELYVGLLLAYSAVKVTELNSLSESTELNQLY